MAFMGMESLLLLAMLGGGIQVNDLISLVQLDAYWQSQGIEVTSDNMVAQLPSKTEQVGDISKLIKQLGDDRFEVREAASKKITQMGRGIIPSERIAKAVLTGEAEDLRAGAYDLADGVWR